MKTAGSNNLKKNRNAWAIFSILNNAKVQARPAIAWRMSAGKKVTADVFIRVIRKSRNEILFRGVDPANHKLFSSLVSGRDKINFFLPEEMVLFQTEVKSFDSSGDATVHIPEMIAQIDRRKHMRLYTGDMTLARAKFQKQTHMQRGNIQLFDKTCFDISAGGFSFIASKLESKFFMKDDKIETVKILAEDTEITVSGKIVNILDVEPDGRNNLHYKARKICVRYDRIEPKDRQFLNDFVFRHADLTEAV